MTHAMHPFTFVKDYKSNAALRASFNALTRKTYGFDFENWYVQGYWPDNYKPYSLLDGEKVIANVSVNLIDFTIDGTRYKTLQIGTVMTDPDYRHQGLSAALMKTIFEEFEGTVDFMYLFANDSVLDFYPKFGFIKANETVHTKPLTKNESAPLARQLHLDNPNDKRILLEALESKSVNAAVTMENYSGLNMFYLSAFMSDCVYYIEALKAVAVAEFDGETLHLMDIFCHQPVLPEVIGEALMQEVTKLLRLGFTPLNTEGYTAAQITDADSTLFVKGSLPFSHAMFPVLSHA